MTTKTNHIINYEVKEGVVMPVEVTVSGGEISVEEAAAYVRHAYEKYDDKIIDAVEVKLDKHGKYQATKEQKQFINVVRNNGGFAGVADCKKDLEEIINANKQRWNNRAKKTN